MVPLRFFVFLASAAFCFCEDRLRVASPDGKVEVQFGVYQEPGLNSLLRLGYQVEYHGKPLLAESCRGCDWQLADAALDAVL